MSSVCISSCADDARVPVRASYVSLYKWPESDAEFVRTVATASISGGGGQQRRVVDSISCRQLYLRSYTFSRKETMPERTRKCLGRVTERVVVREGRRTKGRGRGRRYLVVRRVKELSCASWRALFRRLLSCTTSVDVADQ